MARGWNVGPVRHTPQAGTIEKYIPNIVWLQSPSGAHFYRHNRGDFRGETAMTKLRLIRFGAASTLTRDLETGLEMEIQVFDSRQPAG